MRTQFRSGREPFGLNMTPMIDVVFLLIIFFLVSSHLAQRETRVPLQLPAASSSEQPRLSSERVTINLLPDGRVLVGSKPMALEQLGQALDAKRRQAGDDLEVRIRGDRRAAYRLVAPVLKAAANAGVWNVTFAVSKSRRATNKPNRLP